MISDKGSQKNVILHIPYFFAWPPFPYNNNNNILGGLLFHNIVNAEHYISPLHWNK